MGEKEDEMKTGRGWVAISYKNQMTVFVSCDPLNPMIAVWDEISKDFIHYMPFSPGHFFILPHFGVNAAPEIKEITSPSLDHCSES